MILRALGLGSMVMALLAPNDGGCGGPATGNSPTAVGLRNHNVDVINMYRAKGGIAPLAIDDTLSSFANSGSVELSSDHIPHKHFQTAASNGTIWQSGFRTAAGENPGDPNGWPVLSSDPVANDQAQIDAIQAMMYAEGPGAGEAHGHYTNIMNPKYHRVGIGLWSVDGKLYLTNDFSD